MAHSLLVLVLLALSLLVLVLLAHSLLVLVLLAHSLLVLVLASRVLTSIPREPSPTGLSGTLASLTSPGALQS